MHKSTAWINKIHPSDTLVRAQQQAGKGQESRSISFWCPSLLQYAGSPRCHPSPGSTSSSMNKMKAWQNGPQNCFWAQISSTVKRLQNFSWDHETFIGQNKTIWSLWIRKPNFRSRDMLTSQLEYTGLMLGSSNWVPCHPHGRTGVVPKPWGQPQSSPATPIAGI